MQSPRMRMAALFAADQILNTGSNFMAVSLVAHVLGPLAFGVFSTAQVVTLVIQVAAQAGSSDHLLAVAPHLIAERLEVSRSVRDRYVALPLVAVLALAVDALSTADSLDLVLSVAAYVCGLAFSDFIRNYLYAYRKILGALCLDLGLAVCEIGSLLYWRGSGHPSATHAWEALAAPYLLVSLVGLYLSTRSLGYVYGAVTPSWFRWRYAIEMGGTLGVSQLAQLAYVAVAGVAFAGDYRAVQLLLGPALLIVTSARALLIFLYARRSDLRTHVIVSLGLGGLCLVWGLICLGLPSEWRELALGRQANVSRSLLVVTIALTVCVAVFTASYYRARALSNDRWTTNSKAVQAAVIIVVTVVAAAVRSPLLLVSGFSLGALLPVLALRQRKSSVLASTEVALDQSIGARPVIVKE